MAKSPSHRPLNLARTVPDSHSSASAATTPKKPPVEQAPERDAPRAAATTKANRTTAAEKHAAATKRRRRAVSSDAVRDAAALSRFGLLPSAEGLARALRDRLRTAGVSVVDLLKAFNNPKAGETSDGSDDFEIDPNEFATAMRKKLGYRGPNVLLTKTFALLDMDGSGKM